MVRIDSGAAGSIQGAVQGVSEKRLPSERVWIALLGAGVAARLAIALGTETYFDEAYYLAWAQRLDAGYFDHPPMIALALALFGSPRAAALVLGGLTLAALAGLARALHGSGAAGLRAAALGAVLPAAVLAGSFATVDAPLHLFWVLALWALVERRDGLAGLCLGLALLSKYTAALLLGAALLSLALDREWRRAMVVGGLALLVFSPVVAWNLAHGGASFLFQLRHGLGSGASPAVAEYLLGQWAVAGPALFPLALWLTPRLRMPRVISFSLWLPPLVFLAASSRTHQEVNWPAMAYLGACAALAGESSRAIRAAGWANAALACGAAVHLVLAPVAFPNDAVLSKVHGWSVLDELKATGARAVFAPTYRLAAQAWLHTGLPAGTVASSRRSQYDLWPPPHLPAHADAVWVGEGEPFPAALASGFAWVEPARSVESSFRGQRMHRFQIVLLRDYQGESQGAGRP
jgi:4-amino-4-deoxy-L-arabinose transferase-like glycosyltransferase